MKKAFRTLLLLSLIVIISAGSTTVMAEEPLEAIVKQVYNSTGTFEMVTVVEMSFSRPLLANERVVFEVTYLDRSGKPLYKGTAHTRHNMEGRDRVFYLLEGTKRFGLEDSERLRTTSAKVAIQVETGGVYTDPYVMEELDIRKAEIYESFLHDGKFEVTFTELEGRAKYTRGAIFLTNKGGEGACTWGADGEGNILSVTLSFNPLKNRGFQKVYAISGINLTEMK